MNKKSMMVLAILVFSLPGMAFAWTYTANMDSFPSIGGDFYCVDRTYGRGSSYSDPSAPDQSKSLRARWLAYSEAESLGLPLLPADSTYPNGPYYTSSREPVMCSHTFPSQQRHMFVQYYFKYDSNWVFNGTMDKQFYFKNPTVYAPIMFVVRKRSDGNVWPILYEGGNIAGLPGYANQVTQNMNMGNMKYIIPGRWHKVSMEVDAGTAGHNDGWVKIWIDDVYTHYVQNIPMLYKTTSDVGFSSVEICPVWGGDNKTRLPNGQSMSVYFDKVTISSEPITGGTSITYSGGSSGATQDKYPNSPSILRVE